jgi:hypothetical protein
MFGKTATKNMKGKSSREEEEKGEGVTEKSKKGGGEDEGKQEEENAAAIPSVEEEGDTKGEKPAMEETPEQIQEWRNWYEYPTCMETYINSLFMTETKNSQLWTCQKRGWFLCWQNLHC